MLCTTAFLLFGIITSALGAPTGNVNVNVINGRTTAIDTSARAVSYLGPNIRCLFIHTQPTSLLLQVEDCTISIAACSFDRGKKTIAARYRPESPVQAVTPPTTFHISFDNAGQYTLAGLLIKEDVRTLVAKAGDHWRLGQVSTEFVDYPYIHSDWDRDEIRAMKFNFNVIGGHCEPKCEGKVHPGGTSELKDAQGRTIASL
ncbi:hypothetical protein DFJ43DRAFT_1066034 [Lentinula guzmanii]|uniref:Uncharacterized protein n=1 Tax=Lentinula guzmanii TaxID=2804957 RepID=A0AA38JQ95_9AGAR|nr:hypothetical protein DFJ43DRAFT_1066034 [Lentinula guzmanii]